jgi:hypothetical protein
VLGGTQGLRDFYIRAAVRKGELRGFSLIYDVAVETIMEPLRATMTPSPFPEKPAAFALPAKGVEYGSGVVVSDEGHIITSADCGELFGCERRRRRPRRACERERRHGAADDAADGSPPSWGDDKVGI